MPKFIDITGQKFGDWTVLKYLGNQKWLCRCSCGVEREVLGKTLRSGASKSCGHNSNTLKDITNQVFGELKVVNYIGEGKWLCECSCGNSLVAKGIELRNGSVKSCGHTRIDKLVQRNREGRDKLEGQQIGDWTVLEYVGNQKYRCRCSCGKEKIVDGKNLLRGQSLSCGHNNGKTLIKDLVGQRFGNLTVTEYLGNKFWKCTCDCGNETIVRSGNLKNGSVKSCGCKQYNRLTEDEIISAINEYINKYGEKPFSEDLSKIFNLHPGHFNRYIREYNLRDMLNGAYGSRLEMNISKLFPGCRLHDRTILKGLELDLYYPDKKLAIEVNGTYWHSDAFKDIYYHQKKTIECAKVGIHLIHIFEYEWMDEQKRNKIIAYLNKRLNGGDKIVYARNTKVILINSEIAKGFLDKYHLQNYIASNINIGCYYNNELIGVMTFGKPRFDREYEYELLRLAWVNDVTVIGGAEKLFNYFLKNYNPQSIITYTDISKFTGNVYTRLGFKTSIKNITKPNYVWVNREGDVLTRYQTMKYKLIKAKLGDVNETEDDIMNRLGYFKVYDCGNLKLTWIKANK